MNHQEIKRNSNYEVLHASFVAVHRRVRIKTILVGLSEMILLTSLSLLCIVVIEWSFGFNRIGRSLLAALFIVSLFVGLVFMLIIPLMQSPFKPDEIARLLGEKFPSLRDRVLNAIQVFHQLPEHPFSVKEIEIVSKAVLKEPILCAVDYWDAKKKYILSSSSFGVLIIMLTLTPFGTAFNRVIHFADDFSPPPAFIIQSSSKDFEITKGNDAELRFELLPIDSTMTNNVRRLSVKILDESGFEIHEAKVYRDSSTSFVYKLRAPEKNLTYFAEFLEFQHPIQSERYKLSLVDRPRVASFQVSITPPAYSRLPVQVLETNFGDASALKGSKISIGIKSTKPIQSAVLQSSDSLEIAMLVKNDSALHEFVLKQEFTYRFQLLDTASILSEKSAEYHLKSLPDDPPQIRLVKPQEKQVDLPENMRLPLAILIKDDFGFSSLGLNYRVSKSNFKQVEEAFKRIELVMTNAVQTSEDGLERGISFEWNLIEEQMSTGDEVEFYAEVRDNDAVTGFKPARTPIYKLRIPSLNELFADVKKEETEILDELEKKIDDAKSLQEELERIQNDLRQKPKADWQDRKAIQEASQKQNEIQQQLQSVEESISELTEKMQDRSLVSEETLQKYQEIRELMEQLKSPELMEAQKKLEDALKQTSDQALREALKNLQFNEEQFKKNLERAKELLERMQMTRQLDESLKRMDEMIQKQEKLLQETKSVNPENKEKLSQLQKEQSALAKDEKELDEALKKLTEQMENNPKAEQLPMQDLSNFKEERQQQNLQKDLQEASQKLSESKSQEALQKQQSASEKMQSQKKQLSEMRQEMKRQKKQEVLQALQNATQSALSLSQEQEELMEQLRQSANTQNADLLRDKMTAQNEAKELLSLLQEDVAQIGKKSSELRQSMMSQLQKAESEMNSAIDLLDQRNPSMAAQRMNNAMAMLNEFGNQASKAMAQMMGQQGEPQAGEGGEGGEEMEGLSSKQGEVNQETESLLGGGEKLSPEQRAQRISQLAAQQRMIQAQLQELARKQQEQKKSGSKTDLLGDLQKLSEEMEKSAIELERQNVSPQLKARQQQILSRMLESSKALQKREKEEQREAKSGKNLFRSSPPEIISEQTVNPIVEGLNRMKSQGFADDYERLIRRYFDALEKEPTSNN